MLVSTKRTNVRRHVGTPPTPRLQDARAGYPPPSGDDGAPAGATKVSIVPVRDLFQSLTALSGHRVGTGCPLGASQRDCPSDPRRGKSGSPGLYRIQGRVRLRLGGPATPTLVESRPSRSATGGGAT